MVIQNWIHPVRRAKKLTQRGLAAKARISPTRMSEIENGVRAPDADDVRAIARVLRVDPDALYPREVLERLDLVEAS